MNFEFQWFYFANQMSCMFNGRGILSPLIKPLTKLHTVKPALVTTSIKQ